MDPQTYGNIAGALLVSGYATFRLIKMFNGKKTTQDSTCPDAGCHIQVGQNKDDIVEVKEEVNDFKKDIYPKITQTSEDVSFIKGWIERGKAEE